MSLQMHVPFWHLELTRARNPHRSQRGSSRTASACAMPRYPIQSLARTVLRCELAKQCTHSENGGSEQHIWHSRSTRTAPHEQRPRRAQTWRTRLHPERYRRRMPLPGRAPDCACRSPTVERKTDEPCLCFDTLKLLLTDHAAAGEGDGHERAQCGVAEVRCRAAAAH
jgi:hypothetical protein